MGIWKRSSSSILGGIRKGHAGLETPARAHRHPLAQPVHQGPGSRSELAVEAAQEGYPLVVAVGGDGTANEAVNGLMQLPPQRRPAFGQLPATGERPCPERGASPAGGPVGPDAPGTPPPVPGSGRGQRAVLLKRHGGGFRCGSGLPGRQVAQPLHRDLHLHGLPGRQLFTYRSQTMRIQVDGTRLEEQCFLAAVGNLPHVGGGIHLPAPGRTTACSRWWPGTCPAWKCCGCCPRPFQEGTSATRRYRSSRAGR